MADLVERVAKTVAWTTEYRRKLHDRDYLTARIVIGTLADALEEHMDDVLWDQGECACEREAMSAVDAFDWLRAQAREE